MILPLSPGFYECSMDKTSEALEAERVSILCSVIPAAPLSDFLFKQPFEPLGKIIIARFSSNLYPDSVGVSLHLKFCCGRGGGIRTRTGLPVGS